MQTNSTDNKISIGQKINKFRKRADLSQMDLELKIGASPGMISRIENGQVNPTKETLLDIAIHLQLTQVEVSDLLLIRPLLPSEDEILQAQLEVQDYFNNESRFAYLLDEWSNIYGASKGFILATGIPSSLVSNLLGKHLYELILGPQFGIEKFFDANSSRDLFARELARIDRFTSNFESTPMFERLHLIPSFMEIWNTRKNVTTEELLNPLNKQVNFNTPNGSKRFDFFREPLKLNSRFEVIEYFPHD